MNPSAAVFKIRRRLIGVVFLLVLALLAWLSIALYHKDFTPVAQVTLYTDSVGNEMHVGAEVMVRGVQVGEVRQITANGQGARLLLAIQPGALRMLPQGTSAEMLPTTLFGERYVDLIPPAHPGAATLTAGSVIRQNQSADALELEQVLNNLLPMLRAVEPEKLSLVLTAIGQGVQGRGGELGQTLVLLNSYLRQLNPQLPKLDKDIVKLAALAQTYRRAAPDLLQALNDFAVAGKTIASQRASMRALFLNLTSASDDLRSFLSANSANMIQLSADSIPTLQILARYSPEFPCTLWDLVRFEPAMNKVLGAGTNQPGLHVRVLVVPPRKPYLPGRDTPVYGDNLGPHCYPIPFPGIRLNDGVSGPASLASPGASARMGAAGKPKAATGKAGVRRSAGSAPAPAATAFGTSAFPGLAGSGQESELVRELAGLALGRSPSSLPDWSSLLLAPLFRGAKVTLG